MQSRTTRLSKQNGFSLIEVGIAAIIAGMVAMVGLYHNAQEIRYNVVRGQVDQMKDLGKALLKYEQTYAEHILNNTAVAGVANTRAPTIAELKALSILDTNFSETNYYPVSTVHSDAGTVASYRMTLRPSPAGCTGTTCSVFGMVYMTNPVVDAVNNIDSASVGEAVVYGGANLGASTSIDRTTFRGFKNSWAEPNPVRKNAVAVPGVLSLRVTHTPDVSGAGSNGNLDMGNKAITGVDYVSGTVGQDLQIKTANGNDLYLQNINDTPSSNMYANFKNSTFTQDVTVMGTLYARGINNSWSIVTGLYDGTLNNAPQSSAGSLNTNDIYLRSTGKWASQMQGVSAMSTVTLGKVGTHALGTHKFCVLTGTEASMGTTAQVRTNQWLVGTFGGAWTYRSDGAIADYAQVSCFD